MSRKKEREEAFKTLYAREVSGDYQPEGESRFIKEIVSGVQQQADELDRLLNDKLQDWRMERVYPVEKTILRMGLYELENMETERAIVINEAVELAKKFGDRDTSSFVNGILDEFPGRESG